MPWLGVGDRGRRAVMSACQVLDETMRRRRLSARRAEVKRDAILARERVWGVAASSCAA
jgi:hypothetical protein